jgi:uncharacterized protein YbjT (DUF2867 family)
LKVLVLGGTGFIGSAVTARLVREGHHVVALGRRAPARQRDGIQAVRFDLADVKRPGDWKPLLAGVDAVINCAGALQDAPGERLVQIHELALDHLFAACEQAGVRRIIHFSAAGVNRAASPFSQSKLHGDERLMRRSLEWFILRPSVVIGRSAYGGSALLRGLAALPVLAVPKDAGPLQLVHLDDVVQTVVICLRPETPARQVLELAGPTRFSFADTVQLFRTWLGWPKQRIVHLPNWAGTILFKLGDGLRLLGWRPPVSSNARRELVYGAIGDPSTWTKVTGITPRDIQHQLDAEPASVQERWFAKLYFLKAAVIGVFGCFWLSTGFVSLGPGWEVGLETMRRAQVSEQAGELSVLAGGLADLLIGAAILYRPTSRMGLYAAILITITYAVTGTVLLPDLWKEPLGPMLKVIPILVLNLVALAVLEDR